MNEIPIVDDGTTILVNDYEITVDFLFIPIILIIRIILKL